LGHIYYPKTTTFPPARCLLSHHTTANARHSDNNNDIKCFVSFGMELENKKPKSVS